MSWLSHLNPSAGSNQKAFFYLTINQGQIRQVPSWNSRMLKKQSTSLTFVFYHDCNLDFVVILHKVVQLNWLLSIENQSLYVRSHYGKCRAYCHSQTTLGKGLNFYFWYSSFPAPEVRESAVSLTTCRSNPANQFNTVSLPGKRTHSHYLRNLSQDPRLHCTIKVRKKQVRAGYCPLYTSVSLSVKQHLMKCKWLSTYDPMTA
jgi:hypothetical protein